MAENNRRRQVALKANIWTLRLARNWLRVALTILALYALLPFAAPVLKQAGADGAANALYRVYSPFCHQFAFRSFFLFGEQAAYPRANTGTGLTPFEFYADDLSVFDGIDLDGFDVDLMFAARDFAGNDQMGYKIALCERDIAIYLALLTGGLIYSIPAIRRRLRPVPLWLYVFLGLGPIGLDGFSQMFGYPPFNFWPPRETLPVFRVLTGAIFGFMNAWLAFPYLEAAVRDTRREIEYKLWHAGIDV